MKKLETPPVLRKRRSPSKVGKRSPSPVTDKPKHIISSNFSASESEGSGNITSSEEEPEENLKGLIQKVSKQYFQKACNNMINNAITKAAVASSFNTSNSSNVDNSRATSEASYRSKKQRKRKMKRKSVENFLSVDEEINAEQLKELQRIFLKDGGEGLTIDQFRDAMKKTIATDFRGEDLEILFMKMDANSDGHLEWDEYISYLLLEYQERQTMIAFDQDTPFPTPMEILHRNHIETIGKIAMLEGYTTRFNKLGIYEPDDASTRCLTISKDGNLSVWNSEWKLLNNFALEGCQNVIDMVCMSNCNTIAVASSAYEIRFYSITPHMAQTRFRITGLSNCALTMEYKFNIQDPNKGVLIWGDTNGSICIIRFLINPNIGLFLIGQNNTIKLTRVLSERIPGIQATILHQVHSDWVKEVKYYKNKQGQEYILSCCLRSDTAVFFAEITEKPQEYLDYIRSKLFVTGKMHFKISKGVSTLAYDPDLNLIATGSSDNCVRAWNPYVMEKSMAVLKGHGTGVVFVLPREGEHQIISISKDSNIRVWDLQDFTCKQSIHGRNVPLGSLGITSAYFNNRHKELILASIKIGIFKPHFPLLGPNKLPLPKSHQNPVLRILFNPLYNTVVSGGTDGMVCLWDLKTGAKTMQFYAADEDGITFMLFDNTKRKLLTGGYDGAGTVWNFNNGEKLKTLDTIERGIAAGFFTRDQLILAGGNKRIRVYIDDSDLDTYHTLKERHTDEISSIDFHVRDQLMATGSYNGDIYIWSVEWGATVLSFNMYESILVINRPTAKKPNIILKKDYIQNSKVNAAQEKNEERRFRLAQNEKDSKLARQIRLLPEHLPWLPQNNPNTNTNTQFPDLNAQAVYRILFLQTRRCDESTGSLFASGTGGWITMWSVNCRGGMVGYFRGCPVDEVGNIVTAMITDSENKMLITGDSKGCIKKWKIDDYGLGGSESKVKNVLEIYSKALSLGDPKSSKSDFGSLNYGPKLLKKYRGHLYPITCMVFIDKCGLFATASTDATVRLWTENGRYIGTFGQNNHWKINFPLKEKELPQYVPEDLQGKVSVKTLGVIKGLAYSPWERIRTMNRLLQGMTFKAKKPTTISKTTLPEDKKDLNPVEAKAEQVPETKDAKALTEVNNKEPSFPLKQVQLSEQNPQPKQNSFLDYSESEVAVLSETEKRSIVKIDQTFQKLQNGITSDYLGKINYKPKQRHKLPTAPRNIRWRDKHPIIYTTMPYDELENLAQPEKPAIIDNPFFADDIFPTSEPILQPASKKSAHGTVETRTKYGSGINREKRIKT